MTLDPHPNPIETPQGTPKSSRTYLNGLDAVGLLMHCFVLATYMLVFVREDVSPKTALMQIPMWLHQCAFAVNTAAICLVVIPTMVRRDWSWIWKILVLVFEAWIVAIILFVWNSFGGLSD